METEDFVWRKKSGNFTITKRKEDSGYSAYTVEIRFQLTHRFFEPAAESRDLDLLEAILLDTLPKRLLEGIRISMREK